MPKVKFNLFDKNTDSETYIFLIFRYNDTRLKYSTGQKITPKFWNFERQRVKETIKFPHYPEFNSFLNDLENEVQSIYRSYSLKSQIPSLEDFKLQLDKYLLKNIVEKESVMTLFAFIKQFIDEKAFQPHNTTKIFGVFFNHLKAFATLKGKESFDFEDITLDFSHAFINYLYAEPRKHSTNYASKMLDILRQILDDATERGYNTKLAYKSKRFRISKEDVQNIYLNTSELKILYEYDFSTNERLERVRDLFIVGAFTGLRFSDFTSLKPEHIKAVGDVSMIQIVTQKTGEPVAIPLHPYVKAILERNNGKIPRPLSNQKMNDYLKEIGQIVGIDGQEAIVKSVAGKPVKETLPKYQLISTHTARRSFATNAYKMGIPSIAVMKITGHRTERQFMKYIKVSKEENAVLISDNPFFKI
jgi:integrase